jgi:hypothetical protein
MRRLIISVAVGTCFALLAAPVVRARGFGGCRSGGYSGGGYHGSSSGGGYHSGSYSGGGYHSGSGSYGSYSGSHSYSGESDHGYGGASGSYNRSYEGAHGGSADVSGEHGAAYGPNGAAAGSTRDVSATGPNGQTYNSQEERGAAAGPNGAIAGGSRSTSATGAYGQTYSGQREGAAGYGAAGYGTAHMALPTDAGYGMTAARAGSTAYAGYHQTEAVGGSVYAARGAAVRGSFNGAGMYGQSWYGAHPGAWAPTGWTAGQAWGAAAWPALGATFGWVGGVQPADYNYGTSVTYQGDQVYYGDQPVATAEQYYQQASSLAASTPAPDPNSGDWTPLGVFALVQKDQSDPQYILQLAVNKSGALGGNYTDLMSGTNLLVQGAVDKKTQRVAWTVGENKRTVGETGLYNLTQDAAPALIHIGKDKTQQWTLVRLKQPEQGGDK